MKLGFLNECVLKVNETDIFYYENIEDSDKAIVFIVHGLAEHAARYKKLAMRLKTEKIGCAALDLPGHGKTAKDLNGRGVWPENAFAGCINAINEIIEVLKQKYNKRIILMGHSMGSFISLGYIEKYGDSLNGCILSGSNDEQPPALIAAGRFIAVIQSAFSGRNRASKLLDKMSFGSFNNNFKPNRTAFDWLSRDTGEVDEYVNDPYCGFVASSGLFKDFLKGLATIYKQELLQSIPNELPIYIFSGSMDPVGNFGKGPVKLAERLKNNGNSDVRIKIYMDARHECLNEINSVEVIDGILDYCKALIDKKD